MGYYTYFTMEIETKNRVAVSEQITNKVADRLKDLIGIERLDGVHDGHMDIGDLKWYNSEDDMYRISKEFPNLVFHLHGDGEESGDIWERHWHDGLVQECFIGDLPPYVPSEMKPFVRASVVDMIMQDEKNRATTVSNAG